MKPNPIAIAFVAALGILAFPFWVLNHKPEPASPSLVVPVTNPAPLSPEVRQSGFLDGPAPPEGDGLFSRPVPIAQNRSRPPRMAMPSVKVPPIDTEAPQRVSKASRPQSAPVPSTSTTSTRVEENNSASGSGMVWVNSDSGIYHRLGGRWYGKTKNGYYTTEAQAKAQGNTLAEK